MERRKEIRLTPDQPLQVAVLGKEARAVTGTVLDVSSRGVSMQSVEPLALNAAVQVESDNMLLLGEVRNCEPFGDGYRVGIAIRHSLTNLAQLRAWNRQLQGTPLRGAVPVLPRR